MHQRLQTEEASWLARCNALRQSLQEQSLQQQLSNSVALEKRKMQDLLGRSIDVISVQREREARLSAEMASLHQRLETEEASSSTRCTALRQSLQKQEAHSAALEAQLASRPTAQRVRFLVSTCKKKKDDACGVFMLSYVKLWRFEGVCSLNCLTVYRGCSGNCRGACHKSWGCDCSACAA